MVKQTITEKSEMGNVPDAFASILAVAKKST